MQLHLCNGSRCRMSRLRSQQGHQASKSPAGLVLRAQIENFQRYLQVLLLPAGTVLALLEKHIAFTLLHSGEWRNDRTQHRAAVQREAKHRLLSRSIASRASVAPGVLVLFLHPPSSSLPTHASPGNHGHIALLDCIYSRRYVARPSGHQAAGTLMGPCSRNRWQCWHFCGFHYPRTQARKV